MKTLKLEPHQVTILKTYMSRRDKLGIQLGMVVWNLERSKDITKIALSKIKSTDIGEKNKLLLRLAVDVLSVDQAVLDLRKEIAKLQAKAIEVENDYYRNLGLDPDQITYETDLDTGDVVTMKNSQYIPVEDIR